MIIAHIVYTAEPLPPVAYGGVEYGVYILAREQAARGHTVYVFAHELSIIPNCFVIPCGNRQDGEGADYQYKKLQTTAKKIKFDIIHDHTQFGLIGQSDFGCPVVRTIYGDPHKEYIHTLTRSDVTYTFISKNFAEFYGYPDAPLMRSAIGEHLDTVPFNTQSRENWLLFVGKMIPIKGAHIAIEWAYAADCPLIMAGPLSIEMEYFEKHIKPHIDGKTIKYVGPVTRTDLISYYCTAKATLVSSDCEDNQPRVVMESMLSGCPVIGTNHPGIYEASGNGIGAKLVNTAMDAAEAIRTIPEWFNGLSARQHILTTRSPAVMADTAQTIYDMLLRKTT